jgi:hypothetical protein
LVPDSLIGGKGLLAPARAAARVPRMVTKNWCEVLNGAREIVSTAQRVWTKGACVNIMSP